MGSKRSHDRRPQSVCAWHIETLEPRVLLSNTLIPVAGAQDVVFDASRDQLDILATSAVQRFDILRQRLLSPIAVDGQLLGGDITPDNRFLYAANGLGGFAGAGNLAKIDLLTGAVTTLANVGSYTTGPWNVVIGADGRGFVTSRTNGSGAVSPNRLDTSTDTLTPYTNFELGASNVAGSPVVRSFDRSLFYFESVNDSIADQFTYDSVADTQYAWTQYHGFLGVGGAASRDGKLIATQEQGIVVSDAAYHTLHTFSGFADQFTFDPVRDVFYLADPTAQVVDAFDTHSWQLLAQVPLSHAISNMVAVAGQMTTSSDGQYLYLLCRDGVLEVPVPQQTGWVSGSVSNASGLGLASVQVYADTNGNGKYDLNEPSAVTDSQGNYTISNLAPGDYTLLQQPPTGWYESDPAGPRTVTVAGGQATGGQNFVDLQYATISGTVYNDQNGDQVRETAEPGIAGWTLYIDQNGNGKLDSGEPTALTDSTGHYTFNNLLPGSTTIAVNSAVGWLSLRPTSTTVVLTNSQQVTFDSPQTKAGVIHGRVYADSNRNGTFDPDTETTLDGWTVYADLNANGSLDPGEPSTISGLVVPGTYYLGIPTTGRYTIREVQQSGFRQTGPAVATFSVVAGTGVTGPDMGNAPVLAAIRGAIFNDANNDGVRQPGEAGVSNGLVYLDANNNGLLDPGEVIATTDLSGNYAFADLPPGSYSVHELLPSGYALTAPGDRSSTVSAVVGQVSSGPVFGQIAISAVTMDFAYLLKLAQHYGQAGTFAIGDTDGDGQVGFSDLLLLAQNYGHSLPVPAATTWTGGGDGTNWSDPLNWSTGAVPGPGDDVVIGPTPQVIKIASPTQSVHSLVSNSPIQVQNGGTLDVHSLVSSSSIQVLGGGTLDVVTTAQLLSNLSLAGGTIGGGTFMGAGTNGLVASSGVLSGVTLGCNLTASGSLTIMDGLTLLGNATVRLTNPSLGNVGLNFFGTQTLGGSGRVVFDSGGTIFDNTGTLTIGPAMTVTTGAGSGTLIGNMVNQGTVSAGTTGTRITIQAAFPVLGAVFKNQGTLAAANGGNLAVSDLSGDAGTLALGANGSGLNLSGSFTLSSPLAVPPGATLTLGGTWSNHAAGPGIQLTGGRLILGGSYTTADVSPINGAGGTINLGGTLRNTGGVLDLDPAIATWSLGGLTILGGALAAPPVASTSVSAFTTFDGVILRANLVLGNTTLVVLDGLTLDGGTLTLSGSAGQTSRVNFQGSQTVGGAGQLVLAGSAGSDLLYLLNNGTSPTTLTVTSDVFIAVAGSGVFAAVTGDPGSVLANAASISVTGATFTVGVSSWSNTGSVVANNSTLNLGGAFQTAAVAAMTGSGSTINLTGVIDNSGATLKAAAGNSWVLQGATVGGGTLTSDAGATLQATGSVTLDSVTIAGNFNAHGVVTLHVPNTLTLEGMLHLTGDASAARPVLEFANTTTLDGTGQVVFDGFLDPGSGGRIVDLAGTLTIGPNITIRTGTGSGSTQAVANLGTIIAQTGGAMLSVGQIVSNQGTFRATGGGTLELDTGPYTGITVDPASTLSLRGGTITQPIDVNGGTVTITGATIATDHPFTGNGNINIDGELSGQNGTILLDPAFTWAMNGGFISGGVLTAPPGSPPLPVTSGTFWNNVTLATDVTVLNGGKLNVTGGLTLNSILRLGTPDGNPTAPATLFWNDSSPLNGAGQVVFDGAVSTSPSIQQGAFGATLTVGPQITVRTETSGGFIGLPVTNNGSIRGDATGQVLGIGAVVNQGLLEASRVGGLSANRLNNQGTVLASGGTVSTIMVDNLASGTLTGGTWQVTTGGMIVLPSDVQTNAAAVRLSGTGSAVTDATRTRSALAALVSNQAGASLTLGDSTSLAVAPTGGSFVNQGGILLGAGARLTVTGAFTQQAGASLSVTVGSAGVGKLSASGAVALDGTLTPLLAAGFDPPPQSLFDIVTGSSLSGTFAGVTPVTTPSGNAINASYTATAAQLEVDSTSPQQPTGTTGQLSADASAVAQLSGTVFNDLNASGVADPGEPPLSGRLVFLDLNGNLSLDPGEPTATSDSAGHYTFADLNPGTYSVLPVRAYGWQSSGVLAARVQLNAGDSLTQDWPLTQKALVRGHAYADLNNNALFDASDTPLAGWSVYADLNNNGAWDDGEPSAVVGADGTYQLALDPGTYFVRLVRADGYVPTLPVSGYYIVAAFAGVSYDRDFGNFSGSPPSSITGTVYNDVDGTAANRQPQYELVGWRVYADLNHNGQYDPDEPSSLTDSSGTYTIAGLPPGTYALREDVPGGWYATAPAGGMRSVPIAEGQRINGQDLYAARYASISGTVYDDQNTNAQRDAGEPALAEQQLFVDVNHDLVYDAGDLLATTGADGTYRFDTVRTGIYSVFWLPVAGRQVSDPVSPQYTVRSGSAFTQDWGLTEQNFVRGTLFSDNNGDGKYDTGDTPASGWTVYADLNNSGTFDPGEPSTVSRPDGVYEMGLPAGAYIIRLAVPQYYRQTYPSYPSAGSYTVGVLSLSARYGNDFGAAPIPLGGVSGMVFNDQNRDGAYEASADLPAAGRTVYVDLNNNGQLDPGEPSLASDANGFYEFDHLVAGQYYFIRVLPASGTTSGTWVQTLPANNAAQSALVTANMVTPNVNFGVHDSSQISVLIGLVYHDLNGNGVYEPNLGDAAQVGWTVFADLNDNGTWDPGEPSGTTDSLVKRFEIDLDAIGVIHVRLVTGSSDLLPTSVITWNIPGGGTRYSQNIGYTEAATITGFVFNDLNGNGIWNSGEPPVTVPYSSVVFVDYNHNGVLDPDEPSDDIYDERGGYVITGLLPGTYSVVHIPQSGYRQTTPASPPAPLVVTAGGTSIGPTFGDTQVPAPAVAANELPGLSAVGDQGQTFAAGELISGGRIDFDRLLARRRTFQTA